MFHVKHFIKLKWINIYFLYIIYFYTDPGQNDRKSSFLIHSHRLYTLLCTYYIFYVLPFYEIKASFQFMFIQRSNNSPEKIKKFVYRIGELPFHTMDIPILYVSVCDHHIKVNKIMVFNI